MSARNLSGIRRQRRIDAGEDERAAKLQRVLNIKSTSASSLAAIMLELQGSNQSCNYMSSVSHARFSTVCHEFALPKEGGGEIRLELCDPMRLVYRLVEESEELQALFEWALRTTPNSDSAPWRLLIGFDEYTPGNKLQV